MSNLIDHVTLLEDEVEHIRDESNSMCTNFSKIESCIIMLEEHVKRIKDHVRWKSKEDKGGC